MNETLPFLGRTSVVAVADGSLLRAWDGAGAFPVRPAPSVPTHGHRHVRLPRTLRVHVTSTSVDASPCTHRYPSFVRHSRTFHRLHVHGRAARRTRTHHEGWDEVDGRSTTYRKKKKRRKTHVDVRNTKHDRGAFTHS